MIRLFYAILLGMIFLNIVFLSFIMIKTIRSWQIDEPGDLTGVLHWEATTNIGSMEFVRNYEYDSSLKSGRINSYVVLKNAIPLAAENHRYFIRNGKGEKIFVDYKEGNGKFRIPITPEQYRNSKVAFLIIFSIAILIMIWICWMLFRFSQSAMKKDFFQYANVKRLKIIGWGITIYGVASFLIESATARSIIKYFFDYTGIGFMRKISISFFPPWFIAGLIIIVIARAFEDGIRLKEEQKLMI